MQLPVEFLAALGFLLLFGGFSATGYTAPIFQIAGHALDYLRAWGRSSEPNQPVSVSNENVEKSDTKVEIHYHFYGKEGSDPPRVSDGGQKPADE